MKIKRIDQMSETMDIKSMYGICSDANGKTEKFALKNIINSVYRVKDNKLQQSEDGGVTWNDATRYLSSDFRWSEENAIQISQDGGTTWSNLSEPFVTENIIIKGYVESVDQLPNDEPLGSAYMVGTSVPFHVYVKTSNDWVDNGKITNVTAGVVQTTGDSTTDVMSQKAVTDNFISNDRIVQKTGTNENLLMSQKAINEEIVRSNLFFVNLTHYVGSSLSNIMKANEWGYNSTTKKVYFRREDDSQLEGGYDMNVNTLYKYGEDFFRWDGNELVKWGIPMLTKSLTDHEILSWSYSLSLEGNVGEIKIDKIENSSHKIIKVKPTQTISILGNDDLNNYYVFVKSYKLGYEFDFVEGMSSRQTIKASTQYNIVVPSDANYMVIGHLYNGTDRTPKSFKIDGYDYIKGIKGYASATEGINLTEKVDELANTIRMEYFNTNSGIGTKAKKMTSDTLGTVIVRIKEGDVITTNSEIDSSGVRMWCVLKDDYTIVKMLEKFESYTVSSEDITMGGTFIAITCRVTEQIVPLSVIRKRIIVSNPKFNDKTIILLGDSQIAQCSGIDDIIESITNNKVINAGFGGCRYSWRTTNGTSPFDAFTAIGVIDAITTGDFSNMYSAYDNLIASGDTSRSYYKKAIDELSSLDFGNPSKYIITIAYGGNDSSNNVPLGEIDSMDKQTLYGAMNYAISTLINKYPNIDVRIVTPTYVSYSYETVNDVKISTEDSDQRIIGQYTRKEYCEKIYEHAQILKIPAYDMYNRGGRNKYNIYQFTNDGIHPTEEIGVKHTADKYMSILTTM
ncbi:MAG: SGNH/GDSL hydrolase family protein [Bacilli bacterium]|nr:SGNH/GDSL hydrolase family protein [Bacilli bacterium]